MSEDCLYLNVVAPARSNDEFPVCLSARLLLKLLSLLERLSHTVLYSR